MVTLYSDAFCFGVGAKNHLHGAFGFGLLPLCLHEEVLDVVQISCSECLGGRRTSVIIDLVYCGERGVAAVVQLCKAGVFLLLMALY